MAVNFGDTFYSEFFKSDGVVVQYISDDEWYFVIQNRPHQVLRAQAKPDDLKWWRRVE